MSRADDILVERARKDFEDGLAHMRERIHATHGRLGAAALEAIVMGAVKALHVRDRMTDDVRHLLGVAHQVADGADARKLAEEHLDHVLRLKSRMNLIAREDDPQFKEVRALALDLFARRLPDLAAMASVADPSDYDDLVRKAFPDRAYVDAMIDDNARGVEAIVAHLEKHPHVLRVPSGVAPKIAKMAREMIAWKLDEVRRGVAEIYR